MFFSKPAPKPVLPSGETQEQYNQRLLRMIGALQERVELLERQQKALAAITDAHTKYVGQTLKEPA